MPPGGLIVIHPYMKYQLATINRSCDSTLDKNLNLVYGQMDGRTDVRTTPTLYDPVGRGRGGIKKLLFFNVSKNMIFFSYFMLNYMAF